MLIEGMLNSQRRQVRPGARRKHLAELPAPAPAALDKRYAAATPSERQRRRSAGRPASEYEDVNVQWSRAGINQWTEPMPISIRLAAKSGRAETTDGTLSDAVLIAPGSSTSAAACKRSGDAPTIATAAAASV